MISGIVVEQRQSPSRPGFLDTLLVTDNSHIVFACPCRSGPNWRTPWSKGGRPWQLAYDWIAPCPPGESYRFEAVKHHRYGLCVLINGGGEVPSQNPVPNGDGTTFRGVFIHEAQCPRWAPLWPGSAGCVTLQPVFMAAFRKMLRRGDTGPLVVVDKREGNHE